MLITNIVGCWQLSQSITLDVKENYDQAHGNSSPRLTIPSVGSLRNSSQVRLSFTISNPSVNEARLLLIVNQLVRYLLRASGQNI